jgi:heat shock protein HslJ
MKTRKPIFLFITFAIVLSACAGSNIADQPNIEGITWVLSTYNGTRPIESAQPTLRFEDGQISGKTGCNHYGGSYQIKGDALNFSDLFNTEMACLDPEGVMEQEQTYLELLRAAQRIELNNGELTIFADPQQTLTFEIQQANSITPTPQPEQQSPIPPTPTAEIPNPTPTLAFEPPAGFNEYQDPVVGITV